jgi:hypothetical protein
MYAEWSVFPIRTLQYCIIPITSQLGSSDVVRSLIGCSTGALNRAGSLYELIPRRRVRCGRGSPQPRLNATCNARSNTRNRISMPTERGAARMSKPCNPAPPSRSHARLACARPCTCNVLSHESQARLRPSAFLPRFAVAFARPMPIACEARGLTWPLPAAASACCSAALADCGDGGCICAFAEPFALLQVLSLAAPKHGFRCSL